MELRTEEPQSLLKWHQTLPYGHYNLEHLQATSVTIEDRIGPLTIAAVCCPKHAIKTEQFLSFYATLRQRFLAGGDYNAKHSNWGSRLITPKG